MILGENGGGMPMAGVGDGDSMSRRTEEAPEDEENRSWSQNARVQTLSSSSTIRWSWEIHLTSLYLIFLDWQMGNSSSITCFDCFKN